MRKRKEKKQMKKVTKIGQRKTLKTIQLVFLRILFDFHFAPTFSFARLTEKCKKEK